MIFRDLRLETFRRIREATSSGVYFSDGDIATAVNAGYMELSDASEWLEEYLEVDLLNARPYYDLLSIIGPGFLSIKPIFDEQVNRWLLPSTVRSLDGNDRRWERVQGRPQRVFLRGFRWMGLYPRTNADGTTVKIYYTRLPAPLCSDTDEPGFPDRYHRGCVDFALADLFAEDGETALALAAWKDYAAVEADLLGWVQERVGRPLTTANGGATSPR